MKIQTKKEKTLDKRTQAIKGAKIALSYHSKELLKGGRNFFKHFGYSALYALKLLGFALQNWGEKQKAKQKDGKAETFKSPLLEDNGQEQNKNLRW
jgi:hypothetical protein